MIISSLVIFEWDSIVTLHFGYCPGLTIVWNTKSDTDNLSSALFQINQTNFNQNGSTESLKQLELGIKNKCTHVTRVNSLKKQAQKSECEIIQRLGTKKWFISLILTKINPIIHEQAWLLELYQLSVQTLFSLLGLLFGWEVITQFIIKSNFKCSSQRQVINN